MLIVVPQGNVSVEGSYTPPEAKCKWLTKCEIRSPSEPACSPPVAAEPGEWLIICERLSNAPFCRKPGARKTAGTAPEGHDFCLGLICVCSWPSVADRGRPWPPVAARGRQWPPVAARGRPWPPVAASGRPWLPVAARGRPWPPVAARGRPWPLVAARGRPWAGDFPAPP